MASRSDISIDSRNHIKDSTQPRLIRIALGSTEILQQDLVDTARDRSDNGLFGFQERLLDPSGKEDLSSAGDGSQLVGITNVLLNAKIMPAANTVSVSEGTITTPDATGISLKDSGADFVADGVEIGAAVVNFTDLSVATVIQIVSGQELLCDPLDDGSDNQFDTSDVYKIWNIIEFDVGGGNVVAQDSTGTAMSPTLTPFGIALKLTKSSSATLSELDLLDVKYLLTALKSTHGGPNDQWYVSAYDGDDASSGNRPSKGFKTIAHAVSVAAAGDTIFVLARDPAGVTVYDEYDIEIDKRISLIGDGYATQIRPSDDPPTSRHTFYITSPNVEIGRMLIDSPKRNGAAHGRSIQLDADHAYIHDCWAENVDSAFLTIQSGNAVIENITLQLGAVTAGHAQEKGIYVAQDTNIVWIQGKVYIAGTTEVALLVSVDDDVQGQTNRYPIDIFLVGDFYLHDNYRGLWITVYSDEIFINPIKYLSQNIVDDLIDPTPTVFRTADEYRDRIADANWDEIASEHVVAGSFGEKNQKAVPSEDVDDYKASTAGLASSADVSAVETKVDVLDGKVDTVDALVDDLIKLTGHNVTKAGDIITIYESNNVTVWRRYDLSGGGRVAV